MNKKDIRWLLAAIPAVILIAAIVFILVNTAGRRQTPTVKPTASSGVETLAPSPSAPGTSAPGNTGVVFNPGTLPFASAEHLPTMNETWWMIPYIDYTIPTYDASALTEAPGQSSTSGQEVVQGDTTAFDPYASGEATLSPDASGDATQDPAASGEATQNPDASGDATQDPASPATGTQGSAQAAVTTRSGGTAPTTARDPQATTARPAQGTTAAPTGRTTAAATEPAGTAAPETWGAWTNPAWNWSAWRVVKAPTTTAEGTEERTGTRTVERFSNYGRKESKNESTKESRKIPKIEEGWSAWKEVSRTYGDWQWGAWEVVNPATCNGKGTEERTGIRVLTITESRTSNTGKTERREADPEAEIKTESRDIPQLKHKYSDKVIPATHTSQGYTLHTCTLCSHSFKDSFTDMLAETWGDWVWGEWSDPPYQWGEWYQTKAPGYDFNGEYGMEERKGTRTVTRTGTRKSSSGQTETTTGSKDQSRTEFRYVPKIKTEEKQVGESWTTEEWGEWVVTEKPTYEKKGKEERKGVTTTFALHVRIEANTGKQITPEPYEKKTEEKRRTQSRDIPMLQDSWGEWKKVEGSEVIPEWTYGEWKVTKPATTTAPGQETRIKYRYITWTVKRTSASGKTETRQIPPEQGTFESENETREIPKLP